MVGSGREGVRLKIRSCLRLWDRGALILGAVLPPFAAAPDDLDHLSIYQGIGNLPPSLVEVAPEGLTGYTESTGCRFLFESQEISEPEGLDLFREKEDDVLGSPTEWAETAEGRPVPDPSLDPGPAPPVTATASAPRPSFIHGSTITCRRCLSPVQIVPSIPVGVTAGVVPGHRGNRRRIPTGRCPG